MGTNEWEPIAVYDHVVRFGNHKHCESGCIIFLICQVTSRDHMFKGSCKFLGGRPSW